jgi:hypothetical protein
MTVQDYLDQHYWTAKQLAAKCALSVDALDRMIAAGLVPQPSYVVAGKTLKSAAFGLLDGQGAAAGDYFHPATESWIERARDVAGGNKAEVLRKLFFDNMAQELEVLNQDVWRLNDAFDDQQQPRQSALTARIGNYWNSFLAGIFGLCVNNPISEREIALKEILQEKLTAVTANGERWTEIDISHDDLLTLIGAYEMSSMPFSPVEYPISSRKRLIDDLRRKCVLV